ncbi:MBL fold metallo-hydrolase [Photorhabdus africana]|uniref:MBL fold metallo-hydrolase n=1 Tax=Photorhabdus africana TaxID=3097554 RepID=UPI002B403BF5|nr:MBL fold metallo-hydrolase [Photorhabdus sp. CRI-LC]
MSKMYLKSNAILEPLLWNWHAWSHLMSPLTASMHIKNRHLKIMKHFIDTGTKPQVKNQKFEGGPVVQLDGYFSDDIKKLLVKTLAECQALIALAEGIEDASQKVLQPAGKTLEPLYDTLHPALKGLVELVYNLDFQPGLKFYESLIWQDYYSTQPQSIAFSSLHSDKRPFILGTPVLQTEENFILPLPFASSIIDDIQRSTRDGIDEQTLVEKLQLTPTQLKSLLRFFSCEPIATYNTCYTGEGVRVRYYGHACLLLETKETTILIDPLISYDYPSNIERFTYSNLPDTIDYVLITHAHQDHFSIETLLKIRHRVKQIVVPRNNRGDLADPSLKRILQHMGFNNIIEMEEMDQIALSSGAITAIPFIGEHAELDIQTKLVYNICLHNRSYFAGADLNNFDGDVYRRAFRTLGDIEVVFIGMECDGGPLHWLYGPLITRNYNKEATRSRTLSGSDCDKATALISHLNTKQAYVYSMGEEPWLNYIMNINYSPEAKQIIESDRFIQKAQQKGVISRRLFGKDEWLFN